jgi:hypothetical protein
MLENLAFLQLQGDESNVFQQFGFTLTVAESFKMHSVRGFLDLIWEGKAYDPVSEITDQTPLDFCGIMSELDCWHVLVK